jgi:hypothetical protein
LSYTPAKGSEKIRKTAADVKFWFKKLSHYEEFNIRAADAKEVGVGNPAEETCRYPNAAVLQFGNSLSIVGYRKN